MLEYWAYKKVLEVFMVCTFFGHRDAPQTIRSSLKLVLSDLIENKNVNMFYVGNNGSFDSMVRGLLREFKKTHNINYYVALAYIPQKRTVIIILMTVFTLMN